MTANQRMALIAGALLLALILTVQGILHTLRRPFSPPGGGSGTSDDGTAAPVSFEAPINFLVLGADQRPDDPGRSDSMLVASFDATDADHPQVRLLSLQRDTLTKIPGHGYDKLNHAYAFGGIDLAKKSVEQLLDEPLDHVVVINMQGLIKVVDAVGGVDVVVDEDMDYDDPYDTPPLHIHFKKGPTHLDGTDAERYVRFRHDAQGDFGRMKRQQQLLRALAAAATKPANLLHMNQLLTAVQSAVQTDLTYGDLLRMALAGRKIQAAAIKTELEDGQDLWMDGVYYLQPDLVKLRTEAYRVLHGKEPDAAFLEQARKDAAAYVASLPSTPVVAVTAPTKSPDTAKDGEGKTPEKPPEKAPGQSAHANTIGLRDGTGWNLVQFYSAYVVQGGLQVVPLAAVPALQQTTIVMHSDNPKLQAQLQGLFVHAKVVVKPDQQAEVPAEVWLGQDLPPP